MDKVLPMPEELNVLTGNRSKNFDIFKQKWQLYEEATKLNEESNKRRLATLLTVIGTPALEVYNTFTWHASEQKTVENVLKKFEKFCKPKKNVTYERHIFLSRKQRSDEKIDDYVKELRILADTCELADLKESLIKDVIVLGITDNRLRENLLKDTSLSLETAVDIARASEKAREQAGEISGEQEVHKLTKRNQYSKYEKDCRYCGTHHEFKKEKCPAFGKQCNKCHGYNHYARKCRKQEINMMDDERSTENGKKPFDEYYIK